MEGAAVASTIAMGALGAVAARSARVVTGADYMAGDAGAVGDASLLWANTPNFR